MQLRGAMDAVDAPQRDEVIQLSEFEVMKETGGKANPKVVNDLLREKLAAR